eukprot:TRINITY_DN15764_c0_g1_i2.p1 TRINITY_DN15764_c0_g1~~TRINITY_DN15764_c0_g1_i2.p1  ORF type:complete len:1407 (+),score=479.41 TRINITY_DN15764_c0_g1_i2:1284-5504(+)
MTHCSHGSKEKDLEKAVRILTKLLSKMKAPKDNEVQLISDALVSMVGAYHHLDNYAQLANIVTSAKDEGFRFEPSEEKVLELVTKQMKRFEVNIGQCRSIGILKQALEKFFRDPANAKVTNQFLLEFDTNRDLVPREVTVQFLMEMTKSEDFTEMSPLEKTKVLKDIDITAAEKPLRAMLETRDPATRTNVLNAMLQSLSKSEGTERLNPLLAWMVQKLAKEETAVKAPVVHTLFDVLDVGVYNAESLGHLEELFKYCLKWGEGPWMEAWINWCAKLFIHYTARQGVKENTVLTFASEIRHRIRAAKALTDASVVRIYGTAARNCGTLPDSALALVGSEILPFVKEAYPLLTIDVAHDNDKHLLKSGWTFPDLVNKHKVDRLNEIIDAAGEQVVLNSPSLCEYLNALVSNTDMSYKVACYYLQQSPSETIRAWTFWRDMQIRALKGMVGTIKKEAQHPCQELGNFLQKLPMSPEDHKRVAKKGDEAHKQHVNMYKPILLALGRVCEDIVKAGINVHGQVLYTAFGPMIVENLKYIPELLPCAKAVVLLSKKEKKGTNHPAQLAVTIGCPTEHTKDIFKYCVENITPENTYDVMRVADLCDPQHVAYFNSHAQRERAPLRQGAVAKRPRFRFQRGRAAARRKASVVAKKKETMQKAETSPDWCDCVSKLFDQIRSSLFSTSYCYAEGVLPRLLRDPYKSKNRRAVIRSLLNLCKRTKSTYYAFNLPDTMPEVEKHIASSVQLNTAEQAVRAMLKPFHKIKRRMANMLTKGLGSLSPVDLFTHSDLFQSMVFKYYPEHVKALVSHDTKMNLPGIVTGVRSARFGGQTTSVAEYVHTLPPSVQQYLWDSWIIPHAFDVKSGGLHNERSDYTTYHATNEHDAKARRLWLGAALASAPRMPAVNAPEHVFNQFFAGVIADRDEVKKLAEEEKDNITKSKKLNEGVLRGARAAQLCLELLLGLRAHDDPAAALDVLSRHINMGVASKVAIPSTAAALRCVNPKVSAKYLHEILDRKTTQAAARSQLGRCCVQLLRAEDTLEFVEKEWKDTGSWVMVDGEEEETKTFASTKVALVCTLVTSPSLRELPVLWSRIVSIAESPTDENIYIATQMLEALAGKNGVQTLNVTRWPLAAVDGLAGLVASFYKVKHLKELVHTVLLRWFAMLKSDPLLKVAEKDARGVINAMLSCSDPELLCAMVVSLTSHRPGLFAEVCAAKVGAIKEAVERRDLMRVVEVRKELKELVCAGGTGLDKVEYGKAIDVLCGYPMTAGYAFMLVGAHWPVNANDRCEADAFSRMADILKQSSVESMLAYAPCADYYAKLSLHSLDDVVTSLNQADLTPQFQRVLLDAISHATEQQLSRRVAEYVIQSLGNPDPMVAASAAAAADSIPKNLFKATFIERPEVCQVECVSDC